MPTDKYNNRIFISVTLCEFQLICFLFNFQMSLFKIMLLIAITLILMEAAGAIFHVKDTHRNHKRRETTVGLHQQVNSVVTRPEEIDPYPKFLHFMVADNSEEGVMADPSSPIQNIRSFTTSRSAHGGRPRKIRHGRKRHGHRSVLMKVLELPVEDPKQLAKFPSLPQPDAPHTITVITDTGRILKGISPQKWVMADEPVQSKDPVNVRMQKEVGLLVKYLKKL